MVDTHIHIIPGVDDGAKDLKMAEAMLQELLRQGCSDVICTSHSDAFRYDSVNTRRMFRKLCRLVQRKKMPIQLYLGCEVYCDPDEMEAVLEGLRSGRIPTMNGTKWVLAEFWQPDRAELIFCLQKLLANGWHPMIAHAERYERIGRETIADMRDAGCLVQVNSYSIFEEKSEAIKTRARDLVANRLVDFVGSDAHRIDHRPPSWETGAEYLYANYEKEYVDRILGGNAKKLGLL